MTYLSSIAVDVRKRQVQRDLNNVQDQHRSVMSMFPDLSDQNARAALKVLYRSEYEGMRPSILVQSTVQPDATRLPDGYTLSGVKELEQLLCALDTAGVLRYRILANTVKRSRAAGRVGKITPLNGDDALEWWVSRAPQHGLTLVGEPVMRPVSVIAREQARNLDLCGHIFDGQASISDAQALRTAVQAGIGRAKAYGFGLLSLAVVTLRREPGEV